jgi:hypothetical protein
LSQLFVQSIPRAEYVKSSVRFMEVSYAQESRLLCLVERDRHAWRERRSWRRDRRPRPWCRIDSNVRHHDRALGVRSIPLCLPSALPGKGRCPPVYASLAPTAESALLLRSRSAWQVGARLSVTDNSTIP